VSTFPTTDPLTIRQALADRLVAIRPTLAMHQASRWTYLKNREVGGATLRSFNLMFRRQVEVGNGTGAQGAYGGGIQYASPVELIVSYPVSQWDIEIFMGTDAQDLSAVLVNLHETVSGMFAQRWSQERRVETSYTGTDGTYIGTHSFTIDFFAVDSVAVAS
jgi:hypothetical protein